MIASEYGHKVIVNTLIDHGANVEAINKKQITAWMIACKCVNKETMKTVIKYGTNVETVANDNCTDKTNTKSYIANM